MWGSLKTFLLLTGTSVTKNFFMRCSSCYAGQCANPGDGGCGPERLLPLLHGPGGGLHARHGTHQVLVDLPAGSLQLFTDLCFIKSRGLLLMCLFQFFEKYI